MDFSVRVVYHDDGGDECPREGVSVTVFNDQNLFSAGHEDGTTDEDGRAHFSFDWNENIILPDSEEIQVKVYLDSLEGENFMATDGSEITICYEYE